MPPNETGTVPGTEYCSPPNSTPYWYSVLVTSSTVLVGSISTVLGTTTLYTVLPAFAFVVVGFVSEENTYD